MSSPRAIRSLLVRLVSVIFWLVALAMISVGAYQAHKQNRDIRSAVAVQGVIIPPAPGVQTQTSGTGRSRSTTHTPIVHYRYEIDGTSRTSKKIFAFKSSTSLARARQIVADHRLGKRVTVYANPSNSDVVFLFREWMFDPYIFMFFPMLLVMIGAVIQTVSRPRRYVAPQPATGARSGWYELSVRTSIRRKLRPWLLATLAWYAVGVAACGHYYAVAEPPYAGGSASVPAVYFAAGLIPLMMCVRYWLLSRNATDVRVFTDRDTFKPGDTINVRIEQTFLRHLLVESARVGLLLDRTEMTTRGRKSQQSTSVAYQDWPPDADAALAATHVSPARPLTFERCITIPSDQPPSSSPGEKGLPRHAWRVAVKIRIADSPDYAADFPLVVQN